LIVFLDVQHSIAVFGPHGNGYAPVHSGTAPSRSNVARVLARPIGYLGDLWQRSMILPEWIVEYQTIKWRSQAAGGAKFDLAQARFHVANAEVFDVAMGEAQRARLELERAANYLLESEALITGELNPILESIRQEIVAAEIDSITTSPDNTERYEKIKAELDHISALL
ncbi:MAG: hypothetical protein ACREQV_10370, partial [Candidatus Binatia bacterium]